MKELTQVRNAVIQALNEAGLTALAAYPAERARQYPQAVAAVDVDAAQSGALGFCNYLGEVYDQDQGTVREVYGKQLEAQVLVEIRGERASWCQTGCEQAAEVLLGGLPEGIRTGELSWEGLIWEKETGMFCRRGRLQCQAVFVAHSDTEDGTFLDFQLRGVLKT